MPFRARVVAATHCDLADRGNSAFRQDLYFRLAVLTLEMPPLRSRPEDIPWLLSRFIEHAASRTDARIRGITALAEEWALVHPWPGNVRELRNRVDRAVALATSEWIMPGDLFPDAHGKSTAEDFVPLAIIRSAAEKRQIERALGETGGQLAKAASLLGVSRTTLWEKMTRLGLVQRTSKGADGADE